MTSSGASRRTLALLTLLSLAAGAGFGGKEKPRSREDLVNIMLSPELAQWLIGPISRIATDQEIRAYLELADDEAADAFIDRFWQQRVDPGNPWPGRQARDVFERRAEEADRLFTEGTNLGRATDRGETLVLYGTPAKRGYAQEGGRRSRTIEIWLYSREAPAGLDGSEPPTQSFFVKQGDLTVRYQPQRVTELIRNIRHP